MVCMGLNSLSLKMDVWIQLFFPNAEQTHPMMVWLGLEILFLFFLLSEGFQPFGLDPSGPRGKPCNPLSYALGFEILVVQSLKIPSTRLSFRSRLYNTHLHI